MEEGGRVEEKVVVEEAEVGEELKRKVEELKKR